MPHRTTVSDLIEDIYDAGLEPARWSDAVVSINDYVGSRACGLISKDSISKAGVTHHYCGVDPHYIELYAATHSRFDPLVTLPRFGRVVSIPDLVSYDEYRKGRFYQEWLLPQGCIDVANVVLEKSKSSCPVLMTFLPGCDMADDGMRQRIADVVPHAHRALLINRAIDVGQSEAATLSDALDGLSAGVILVDSRCRVVHANASARGFLDMDDFLHARGGQLTTSDARANQLLRKCLGDNEVAAKNTAAGLPLMADDGEQYVLHVFPVRSVARNHPGMTGSVVAALFIRRVELNNQSGAEIVARAFELTPTELRVMMAIVEVGGVPETAKSLGIAETTVKTHLRRVFAKTGANRQADLVKLTAGYATPLAC